MFTALERATLSTKSFLIGLAVVKRYLNVEQAAQAASVEVDSQIQVWGEVEDSTSHLPHLNGQVSDCLLAHDVDYQDVRRQLGSAALLLSSSS